MENLNERLIILFLPKLSLKEPVLSDVIAYLGREAKIKSDKCGAKMAEIKQTVMEMVNHLLKTHPELAPAIEQLAALAQGKTKEQFFGYYEWVHYGGLSTQDAFTKIYDENHWGKSDDPAQPFYSGVGSHAPPIVDTYIKAVKEFLSSLEEKPTVVDLGCGDFYVGAQLRDLCGDYIACDIVEPLIKFNKEKYKSLNVDFRVLDLSNDEMPAADVVFIRQVIQHLSNKEILASLDQICSKYKYLILTEHLPGQETFTPNLDKPSGRYNRVAFCLTSAPMEQISGIA
jgi:hypothetical protein